MENSKREDIRVIERAIERDEKRGIAIKNLRDHLDDVETFLKGTSNKSTQTEAQKSGPAHEKVGRRVPLTLRENRALEKNIEESLKALEIQLGRVDLDAVQWALAAKRFSAMKGTSDKSTQTNAHAEFFQSPRGQSMSVTRRSTQRPSQEEPVTPATQKVPRQNAHKSIWREIKKNTGWLLFCASAAGFAWEMWTKTQPNCYGHVAKDVRYKVPGGMAGQPAQEPYTCPGVLAGVHADGFEKPLAYAADGCSVQCHPGSDPVFIVTGKTEKDILGLTYWKGTDFHMYIAEEGTTQEETKNNEAAPRIFSHKPGIENSPRSDDGSGNLITCPPKSNHHYTRRDSIVPLIRRKADYKNCGWVCSFPRGAAIKDARKQRNDRGR